jgi:hypothetical protein
MKGGGRGRRGGGGRTFKLNPENGGWNLGYWERPDRLKRLPRGGRGGAGGLNTVPQVPGHRQLTITAHLPLLICMWEKRNEGLCLCKETFMKPI